MQSNTSNRENRPLIAHVINRLHTGGMENGLVNLINGMPEARYRHAIICLTESSDFANRIRRPDVQIAELHKRPGKDLGVYWRFWRVLRRLRPTIVHTRNIGTLDMAPIAAIAGVPTRIHGEHGWDISDPRGIRRKYRIYRKACNPMVSGYISVSRDIASWLIDSIGLPEERVRQIYNGVDTRRFCPDGPKAELPFAKRAGEQFVIGTVGRLDPIKNHEWLISTFASVVHNDQELGSRLRLVIAGEGDMRPRIEERIVQCGVADRVWVTGMRDDIPDVLRSFDLFVLPSINEGISNTLLESMATGLPVVASKAGGNTEIVQHGKTGLLTSVGDASAFTQALMRYVEQPDLRREHGEFARREVQRQFSLQSMVDRYGEIYDRYLHSDLAKTIN